MESNGSDMDPTPERDIVAFPTLPTDVRELGEGRGV